MENLQDFIYIHPKAELIAPQSNLHGAQSVKIKLINSNEKEIIIYPSSIGFENGKLIFSIDIDQLKYINSNGKSVILKESN